MSNKTFIGVPADGIYAPLLAHDEEAKQAEMQISSLSTIPKSNTPATFQPYKPNPDILPPDLSPSNNLVNSTCCYLKCSNCSKHICYPCDNEIAVVRCCYCPSSFIQLDKSMLYSKCPNCSLPITHSKSCDFIHCQCGKTFPITVYE